VSGTHWAAHGLTQLLIHAKAQTNKGDGYKRQQQNFKQQTDSSAASAMAAAWFG
jgi:hypothetical protein